MINAAPDDDALAARILAKTNEYLDFPSVVGHETPFLDHLARDFRALGLNVERRPNLAIVDAGAREPVFAVHVDRHGAVVAENGLIRFAAYAVRNEKYGEDARPSLELARKVAERYVGEEMFAYDRTTGGRLAYAVVTAVDYDDAAAQMRFSFDDLPALPPRTPIALARPLKRHDGAYVSGQLDNPLSAAILRVLAEQGLRGAIVFTAEEEIGRSAGWFLGWAQAALRSSEAVFVVDTSPFPDASVCDEGAVILRRRDATAGFAATAVERACAAVAALSAPHLFKDEYVEAANALAVAAGRPAQSLGLTELGRIVKQSGGAISGATVQIPTFGYHSNQETTSPAAIVNVARALMGISRSYAAGA